MRTSFTCTVEELLIKVCSLFLGTDVRKSTYSMTFQFTITKILLGNLTSTLGQIKNLTTLTMSHG